MTYSSNASNEATFGAIAYSEPGTYYYTITEETPATVTEGMNYNTASYWAKVEVDHTQDGKHLEVKSVKYGSNKEQVEGTSAAVNLNITNTYQIITAPISVTKTLTGREWTDADSFEFKLTATDGTPMPETTTVYATEANKSPSFGSATYLSAGTYTYTIQETKKTNDGITYDTSAHTVTVTVSKDDTTKALSAIVKYDGKDSLEITNVYTVNPTSVTFKAKKTLTGRPLSKDEFEFKLLEKNGSEENCLQTKKNEVSGDVSFDSISYDSIGTHTYIIRETADALPGVTYDPKEYTVTVNVTDNGIGQLVAAVSGLPADGTAAFTNEYKTGILKLKKSVTGNACSTSDEFTYTVELKYNDQPLSGAFGGYTFNVEGKTTVQVSAASDVMIDGIPAGTTYTVTEELTGTSYTNVAEENSGTSGTIIAVYQQKGYIW